MTNKAFYNTELELVEVNYTGFLRSVDFIECAKAHLDLMKKQRSKNTLVDIEKMKVLAKESQEFINQIWFSEANKIGVKNIAFVVPESVFGQVSMQTANKTASKGINVKYFLSRKEAIDWLASVK